MLFSEPKIPQITLNVKSLVVAIAFQCSSASRKFLKSTRARPDARRPRVSVLFSEPKIPQIAAFADQRRQRLGFSALQRAENSSNFGVRGRGRRAVGFQCSSASRKFLKRPAETGGRTTPRGVSVLFSEPKIPQCYADFVVTLVRRVSVLFSEPKIPQCFPSSVPVAAQQRFQCSSASRKFLNFLRKVVYYADRRFQCSSASRKFLNSTLARELYSYAQVSVLFSEPKIPQYRAEGSHERMSACFSALQRAENSSILRVR